MPEDVRPTQPDSATIIARLTARYTRAKAFADGELIDISATARAVGFSYPVAMSAAAWAEAVGPRRAALWPVLHLARSAVVQWRRHETDSPSFSIIRRWGGRRHRVPLVLSVGIDDYGLPALTLMLEGEG